MTWKKVASIFSLSNLHPKNKKEVSRGIYSTSQMHANQVLKLIYQTKPQPLQIF